MHEIKMKVMEFDRGDVRSFQDFCEFIRKFVSDYLDSTEEFDMDPMQFFCCSSNAMYFINPLQFSEQDKILNLLAVKKFCQEHEIEYLGTIVTAEMRVVDLPAASSINLAMEYQRIKEFYEPFDIIWIECLDLKSRETKGFGWKIKEDGYEPYEISDVEMGRECNFYRIFLGDREALQ